VPNVWLSIVVLNTVFLQQTTSCHGFRQLLNEPRLCSARLADTVYTSREADVVIIADMEDKIV